MKVDILVCSWYACTRLYLGVEKQNIWTKDDEEDIMDRKVSLLSMMVDFSRCLNLLYKSWLSLMGTWLLVKFPKFISSIHDGWAVYCMRLVFWWPSRPNVGFESWLRQYNSIEMNPNSQDFCKCLMCVKWCDEDLVEVLHWKQTCKFLLAIFHEI